MNQKATTKREFPYVTLILVVTLVLVVAILGYSLVDSIGIIGRLDNAAKSNNFKMNENHLDVYRYHVAQNQLYTEYMYYAYGLMTDSMGITSMFSSPAQYANYMIPNYVGSGSFDATAYSYAEQYLTYCEGAREAGLYDEYLKEVASDIDAYIEELEANAKANGVSLSSYLKQWIGIGVSKGDVEEAMEYYYVGIKYAEKLTEDYKSATTIDEIKKYVEENKSSFYKSEYTSYELVNNDLKDAIDACKTVDDVKTAIVKYYVDQKFESVYKTNITDKENITDTAGKDKTKADVLTTILALNEIGDAKAVFTSDQTGDYEKAAYSIVTSINTTASTEVKKVTESSSAYADPTGSSATDLQKWLFGEGRKVGDTHVIETKSTSKDSTTGKETTTTTYTWYIVEDMMVLDTEKTKDAYYISLTDDESTVENAKTAVQKAEEFYKELEAAKTEEKFCELVEKYVSGSTASVSEKLSYESIKSTSEEFADWLYAEGRKQGDITKVEVKGDSKDAEKVTSVLIAYFMEENEETWQLSGRESVANEKVTDWYDEAVKKYNVTIDYEPETTAATTTSASTTASTSATTEPAATEATTTAGTEASTEAGTDAGAESESATEAAA